MRLRNVRAAIPVLLALLSVLTVLEDHRINAAVVNWDDGGLNKLWSSANNWDPLGVPTGFDDVFIGNLVTSLGDETLMNQAHVIGSLTLSNDVGVANSADNGVTGFELQLNGLVSVQGGASMDLFGAGTSDALDTEQLEIVDGIVRMDSTKASGLARIEIESSAASSLDIQANGTLIGNGRIDLEGSPATSTRLLRNNGTLSAGHVGLFGPIVPATTLQITATSANATIDLDGTGAENGIVNVNKNATLDIDTAFNDDFNGELNLRSGSTFETEFAMGMVTDTGANINVTTTGLLGTPDAAASMSGGTFQMRGGTLTLGLANDTLIFDNDVVLSSGTVDNNGTIVFNNGGLAFLDFQMNGPHASITVGENSSVRISDQDFNLDGTGAATNVTTVQAGGKLTVALNDILADDGYNGTINLNGGELEVTNDADNSWSIGILTGGQLNAGAAATSTLSGDQLTVFDEINVAADSELVVGTDSVIFGFGSDINIESGATLDINTDSNWFDSNASVTGAGELRPGSFQVGVDATNTDDVVWDVAIVDLDDGGGGTIQAGSSLTVNADTIDPQDGKFSQDLVIGDQAKLQLNLNNDATAVFGALSNVTVNGNLATETTFFDSTNGTDVKIDGSLVTSGDTAAVTRMTFDNADVDIGDATGYFKLAGGTQAADDSNVSTSTVFSGPGQLRIANDAALRGNGSISATLNGAGNSRLIAEDGAMNVNGTILQIGTIGAVTGGTLNVTSSWDTSVANDVRLGGGILMGATISNNGAAGINGWGTVVAEIINESRIDAEDGGVLVVDNSANDWDGTANMGSLNAISGDLELRDDVGFAFGGTARAQNGQEIWTNGFALNFLPTASLELVGGTYRSTANTDFLGTLTASGTSPRLEVDGEFRIVSGSVVTLNSNLQLANVETIVEPVSTFVGGGALNNLAGSTLRLLDGAGLNVLVQNAGTVALGDSPGQVTGIDFRQLANGTLEIDLEGTAPTEFDRMSLAGLAQLDGTLEVSLLSGFAPMLGDEFPILSAVGGVTGTFSTLDLPSLASGLAWDVAYDPTLVNLMVIALTGDPDFNTDGTLDCLDVDSLVAEIVAGTNGTAFDLTADGIVDELDLTQWLAGAGAANLPSAASYLEGDANLDGAVDGNDFLTWNANKFTNTAAWCSGDFNADGSVDGADFLIWNSNKFTSADQLSPVPEPSSVVLGLMCILALLRRQDR